MPHRSLKQLAIAAITLFGLTVAKPVPTQAAGLPLDLFHGGTIFEPVATSHYHGYEAEWKDFAKHPIPTQNTEAGKKHNKYATTTDDADNYIVARASASETSSSGAVHEYQNSSVSGGTSTITADSHVRRTNKYTVSTDQPATNTVTVDILPILATRAESLSPATNTAQEEPATTKELDLETEDLVDRVLEQLPDLLQQATTTEKAEPATTGSANPETKDNSSSGDDDIKPLKRSGILDMIDNFLEDADGSSEPSAPCVTKRDVEAGKFTATMTTKPVSTHTTTVHFPSSPAVDPMSYSMTVIHVEAPAPTEPTVAKVIMPNEFCERTLKQISQNGPKVQAWLEGKLTEYPELQESMDALNALLAEMAKPLVVPGSMLIVTRTCQQWYEILLPFNDALVKAFPLLAFQLAQEHPDFGELEKIIPWAPYTAKKHPHLASSQHMRRSDKEHDHSYDEDLPPLEDDSALFSGTCEEKLKFVSEMGNHIAGLSMDWSAANMTVEKPLKASAALFKNLDMISNDIDFACQQKLTNIQGGVNALLLEYPKLHKVLADHPHMHFFVTNLSPMETSEMNPTPVKDSQMVQDKDATQHQRRSDEDDPKSNEDKVLIPCMSGYMACIENSAARLNETIEEFLENLSNPEDGLSCAESLKVVKEEYKKQIGPLRQAADMNSKAAEYIANNLFEPVDLNLDWTKGRPLTCLEKHDILNKMLHNIGHVSSGVAKQFPEINPEIMFSDDLAAQEENAAQHQHRSVEDNANSNEGDVLLPRDECYQSAVGKFFLVC